MTSSNAPPCETAGAKGGRGGDASAAATTTIISGPAEADATSIGGSGGFGGGVDEGPDPGGGDGGSATAIGDGQFGIGECYGFGLGDMVVPAAVRTMAWRRGRRRQRQQHGHNQRVLATRRRPRTPPAARAGVALEVIVPARRQRHATADASATGGGKAIATAVATEGFPSNFGQFLPAATANATSNAETVNGAMAEALSTVNPNTDEAAGTSEVYREDQLWRRERSIGRYEYNLPRLRRRSRRLRRVARVRLPWTRACLLALSRPPFPTRLTLRR